MRWFAKLSWSARVSARCRSLTSGRGSIQIVSPIIFFCTLLFGYDASPQTANVSESGVKAAFLYGFLSYVEWPPDRFSSQAEPIVIGVLENETVAAALREIAAQSTVDERELLVRSMRRNDPLEGLHVLFIGRDANTRLEHLVAAAQERSIMTVTETQSAHPLAVIDFVLIDGEVRFSASVPAADRTGIKLSSRLLAIAETVHVEAMEN
jgi:hypothetical protein